LDFVAEFDPQVEMIGGPISVPCGFALAPQFVEMAQHLHGKTSHQSIARQTPYLLQRAQAHARECGGHVRRKAGALDGQLSKRTPCRFALSDGKSVMHIGQYTCGQGIGRGDDAMMETQRRQFLAQLCYEPRPRPEQAQASPDLQNQCMGELQADLRAETVGPSREEPLPM